MYRFFVDSQSISGSRVQITGADAHHIRDVLRLGIGEEIIVCTGDEWEYTCEISMMTREEIHATIIDADKPGKELPSKITLYQCLPKRDKMELIIQKAVELGAYEIIPVTSARVIVQMDKKKEAARVERWNGIAQAAAKQSGRMIEPKVGKVLTFAEAVMDAAGKDVRLIPYEKSEGMDRTREIIRNIRPGESIAVFIGPEGGFEEQEIAKAREYGLEPISLGKRILRTETAGMSVLSVLGFLLDS